MTEIIIPKLRDPHDVDAPKDCPDFAPLDDGTIAGDKKYCRISFLCKQIGMLSEYAEIYSPAGIVIERDYLCTGKYPIFEERSEDERAK